MSSPAIDLAASLFDRLATETATPPGVTRASFGAGEQFAHALVADAVRDLGLIVTDDIAGNRYMTWPGHDRALPRVFIGSHLDSVPHGGNFDGAAGVIMGLAAIRALKDGGFEPQRDIVVMAIRAEELVWFPTPYAGSRMAFGLVPAEEYEGLVRSDTGRTLADHMRELGFDPDALREGARPLDPATIEIYIEPHIEQGPHLVGLGKPVGIVTGIRGNLRYPNCIVRGTYGHAGATPRAYRHDAVFAATDFARAVEDAWDDHERNGRDFVATLGQFTTDARHHGMTKISGEVRFTMDLRSLDNDLLLETDRRLRERAREISKARRVEIDLDIYRNAPPAIMDQNLINLLEEEAKASGIDAVTMPSGAGHDCATFAWQGIRTAMLFIRNENGSHNPDEAMAMDDFAEALKLLVRALRRVG